MSFIKNILGADVKDVLGGAVSIFSDRTALQIAQLNLAAQQSQAAVARSQSQSNADQNRLLITIGVLGAGAVLAVRLLRKK